MTRIDPGRGEAVALHLDRDLVEIQRPVAARFVDEEFEPVAAQDTHHLRAFRAFRKAGFTDAVDFGGSRVIPVVDTVVGDRGGGRQQHEQAGQERQDALCAIRDPDERRFH